MASRPYLSILLLVLAAALFLPAPELAAGEGDVVWRAGTLAPKRIGWAKQVEDVVLPAFAEASGGRLEVKVYYGGILGDDEHILNKMRKNILQVGGLAGQGTIMAVPEMSVLSLPFLFQNYEEVDAVRQSMHTVFEKYARQKGFVLFMWIDQDFDQVYSTAYPMATLADFRRSRFIAWYGDMENALFDKLGAASVHTNVPEVSAALRSGKADATIAPALWMLGAQLQSVIKYVNPCKIRYSPVVIINTVQSWDSVPAAWTDRIWKERMELVRRFVVATRRDDEQALNAMVEYGVRETELTQPALAALKQATWPIWTESAGTLFPKPLLDEVEDRLTAFRKEKAGSR